MSAAPQLHALAGGRPGYEDVPVPDAAVVPGPSRVTFQVVDDAADLPGLVGLAREAHAESRLRDVPFSQAKARRIGERALADPTRHAVMLARHGEAPAGLLYYSAGGYLIGTDVLLASVHTVFVAHRHRDGLLSGRIAMGLLNGARSWARARGAAELSLHVASGIGTARTVRLLRRLGFAQTGGNYALRLAGLAGAGRQRR